MVEARALGADMVLVGRPLLYALAAVGPEGAERMFDCFKGEIDTALARSAFHHVGRHTGLPLRRNWRGLMGTGRAGVWDQGGGHSAARLSPPVGLLLDAAAPNAPPP